MTVFVLQDHKHVPEIIWGKLQVKNSCESIEMFVLNLQIKVKESVMFWDANLVWFGYFIYNIISYIQIEDHYIWL